MVLVIDRKEFRCVADEAMRDINAGRELKERTLRQCMKKKHKPVGWLLTAAACFVLTLGVLNITGLLQFGPRHNNMGDPQIMLAQPGMESNIMPGTDNGTLPESAVVTDWVLETPGEAETVFGDAFLLPAYIPENYKLAEVHASGDGNTAYKIVLTYFAGERPLLIIEDKTERRLGFAGYKQVDINGTAGYSKPEPAGEESSAGDPDTEVHWFKNGVHYSVFGRITEEEAVKIAASMK